MNMTMRFKIDKASSMADIEHNHVNGEDVYRINPENSKYKFGAITDSLNEGGYHEPWLLCSEDGNTFSIAMYVIKDGVKYTTNDLRTMTVVDFYEAFSDKRGDTP